MSMKKLRERQAMTAIKQVLKDKQYDEKYKPYKELKRRSIEIAKALYRDESGSPTYNRKQRKVSREILNCARELKFKHDKVSDKLRLTNTYFCHQSLCPMCEVRRYNHDSARLYHVIDYLENSQAIKYTPKYLFATLTIKNVDEDHVRQAINELNAAWNKLKNYKAIKPYLRGAIKRIEIKLSKDKTMFNVHIHAMLLVKSGFHTGKYSLTHSQWSKLWTRAVNKGYTADIDIARLKDITDVLRAMHYMVKVDEDITQITENATDSVLESLITADNAKYRKHLLTLTGVFKDIDKLVNYAYKRRYKNKHNAKTGKIDEYNRTQSFDYDKSDIVVFKYSDEDYYLRE